MPAFDRRRFLTGTLAAAGLTSGLPGSVLARERRAARAESPQVGVDPLFVESGLTARWQAAMRQDLGLAAQWLPLETGDLLAQLEEGRIETGVFLSTPKADDLDHQGLIHDRRTVARIEVLLVGPARDPAGIHGETDPARALTQILAAHAAGASSWQQAPANTALAALADHLTQGLATRGLGAKKTVPPGGKTASPSDVYRLVTRPAWQRQAPSASGGAKVWLAGGDRLTLACQVAQSFRYRPRHPEGKLLAWWLQGSVGQSVVRQFRPVWLPYQGKVDKL